MGRAKTFDEKSALQKAMRLFWQQGYANTSLKQLLAEMNMLNGSFYHCFKDKKTVFLKSLECYNEEITYQRQQALASHDNFSEGIRALFDEVFITLSDKSEPNGCLIVNSMATDVLAEDELKQYMYKDFEDFIAFITQRIEHSINKNFTRNAIPAKQLALILVTYIQGLFRISYTNLEVAQLKCQTETLLTSLKL